MLVLDTAAVALALFDLLTLSAPAACGSSGTWMPVCSLNEPGKVELTIENLGRAARFLTVRDDVPDEFAAEPAAFELELPGRAPGSARVHVRSQAAGHVRFARVDALCVEPARFLAAAGFLAGLDGGAGLSRHPPGRAVSRCWPAATG